MPKEKFVVKNENLFRLKFITEASLSPDGSKLLYGLAHTNTEKEEDVVNFWLQDLKTGASRQLTFGEFKNSAADWSPDGNKIVFQSSRSKKNQIFVLDIRGGEALPLVETKRPIGEGPFWSPDGKFLAFTSSGVDEIDYSKPYRVTRKIYRFDRVGYLDDAVQEIFVVPAAGGEPRRLTNDDWNKSDLKWSPDGQEILFMAGMNPESFTDFGIIRTVDMTGKVREIVGSSWGMANSAVWTPDSKNIVFTGVEEKKKMGSKANLWVVRRRGGKPENRSEAFPADFGNNLQDDMPVYISAEQFVSSDSSQFYTTVQDGGKLKINKFALTGEAAWETVLETENSCVLLGSDGEKLLYYETSWSDPMNLFTADIQGKNIHQLTAINQEELEGWLQPVVENLKFKSPDGQEVEGWIMKPAVGEAPYPTILYVHGGPNAAFGNSFAADFQLLAGAGFAVLFINPRGSTGYGSKFGTDLNLHWGDVDYEDQMAGVDYAIEKGIADPEHLGMYGLSYGGYMTCWTIGQTRRFKAAVSENPVSDLVSDYGTGDTSLWMDLDALGGHPFEMPELYKKCSPITYAHTCTTPTLFLQGEADFRCPAIQTEQMYTTLKANGCVAEMVRFPKSFHAASIAGEPIIRRVQNEVMLDWFNRYILGETEKQSKV